ncbi:MAG TPA: hypothetical protein VMU22_02140 [Rhizomicrobium sp.]|nr:hypothetical protein [Rhizomicrobium sp.]
MHRFNYEESVGNPRSVSAALCFWGLCAALLLGPSLLVWVVRGAALFAHCDPGPGLCRGVALGGGLRDTLALAWFIGANTFLALVIALVSAALALSLRRPLMAAMGLLLLPIAAVVLPSLAVAFSSYAGCQVNEDGIGDCVLWGAKMGMSFHDAAIASSALYDMVPYSFALALMVGAVGFVFFRPKDAR